MALDWMDDASPEAEQVAPVEQVTEEPEAQIEAQPEPEAAPEPEVVRDEQGRFAPKQNMVPLSALESERREKQAYKARLEAYEQQQAPDPEYDLAGYTDHQVSTIQQQLQAQLFQQSLTFSRRLAEQVHTPEAVAQAHEWGMARCDADPLFNQRVSTSPDPYEFVVSEWKRDQVLSRLQGNDLDQFLAWKAQQANPLGQAQPQPAAPAAIPQPVAPPRSLASAPAAGTAKPGAEPVYQGAAFDAVFRN